MVLQGSGSSEIFSLDLSSLPPSVYSLKVYGDEQTYEQNIIKQ